MSFIIRIPEPCSEDWNQMTPTEKGRYCAVCQREIYDFTHLTHRQLANKIKRKENICGLFRKDQLDVDLYADTDLSLKKIGMMMSVTVMLSNSPSVFAQIDTQHKIEVVDSLSNPAVPSASDTLSHYIKIIGQITEEETGEPLPGVNVVIKGTQTGTVTDFSGNFSLEADLSKVKLPLYLEVSYVGYEDKEIEIPNPEHLLQQNGNIEVKLKTEALKMNPNEEVVMLGAVVCVRRNIFQRIGDWFRRIFNKE